MTKAEALKLETRKIYKATYNDGYGNHEIMFAVKDLTNAGTKTKTYIIVNNDKYVDLKTNKLKSIYRLNWLGCLDISKLKELEELKTIKTV